jgi:hypothetical protein
MTEREELQKALEALREYHRKYTPKERFQHMVDSGIINSKGQVLMTRAEREAGHPLDDEPTDGTQTDSENGQPMTENEMVQKIRMAIEEFCRTVPTKEQWARLVAAGIINEKGEVVTTRAECESGHPRG